MLNIKEYLNSGGDLIYFWCYIKLIQIFKK